MKFCRYLCLLSVLFVAGCLDFSPTMLEPEPHVAMTEHTKRAYSTLAFVEISDYTRFLRERLEPEYGLLRWEGFQLPESTSFPAMVEHYESLFAQADGWTKLDEAIIKRSESSKAVAWNHKDKMFILYATDPVMDTDMMPVYTLSNLATERKW